MFEAAALRLVVGLRIDAFRESFVTAGAVGRTCPSETGMGPVWSIIPDSAIRFLANPSDSAEPYNGAWTSRRR